MDNFLQFYQLVICKKRFYVPIFFFAIVAYSFSIYNRTVSWDDMFREYYISSDYMLAGRWGMVLWTKIMGLAEFSPFIDRFLALFFFIIAALLFCFVLYLVGGDNAIIPYIITASVFISYPLINEIWEYSGAPTLVAVGICLAALSIIVVRSSLSLCKKIIYASLLLLLPMSSYEVGVFCYISLVSIVIYYETSKGKNSLGFLRWIRVNFYYFIPVALAFVVRFLISFLINSIFDLHYFGGGSTQIVWDYGIIPTIKGLLVSNTIYYFISGLLYFPISVFVLSFIVFVLYTIFIFRGRITNILLGVIVVLSVFSQSLLQGDPLPYRHAATITLFVSFVVYLISTSLKVNWHKIVVLPLLFYLCWLQSIYMNRILSLNNLRSDNELSLIRQIGFELESKFEKKPIVVVSIMDDNSWISRQVLADNSTWNGRLFFLICDKIQAHIDCPYKFIHSNVNSMLGIDGVKEEKCQINYLLEYCGYKWDVVSRHSISPGKIDLSKKEYVEEARMLKDAIHIAKEKKLRPYQIYDNGKYLVLRLGGDYYECN